MLCCCRCFRRTGHSPQELEVPNFPARCSAECAPNAMVRCRRGIHFLKIAAIYRPRPRIADVIAGARFGVGTVLCRRCRRLTNSDQVRACSRLGVDTSFLGTVVWSSRRHATAWCTADGFSLQPLNSPISICAEESGRPRDLSRPPL